MRHRSVLFLALLCIVILRLPAQQPLSEEEKRRAFLKAREEMTTIPYTPSGEPGSKPKPKPHATPIGEKPPPRVTPGAASSLEGASAPGHSRIALAARGQSRNHASEKDKPRPGSDSAAAPEHHRPRERGGPG